MLTLDTYNFPQKDTYSSCRRWYLDAFLTATPWHGRVLDIGGKKENKRGAFRPPLDKTDCWEYANIDRKTQPDFLAPADALPVPDASYDMALLSEVLEHLPEPEKSLSEVYRILRAGGQLVCAAPFLYPLHADPDDYQRWLPAKYLRVLGGIGFTQIMVRPMGGFFAVCHDLLQLSARFYLRKGHNNWKAVVLRKAVPLALAILLKLEIKHPHFYQHAVNTGYYIDATKP